MLSAVRLCRLPTTLDADSLEQSALADLCHAVMIYRQASARRNIRLILTFSISHLVAVIPGGPRLFFTHQTSMFTLHSVPSVPAHVKVANTFKANTLFEKKS